MALPRGAPGRAGQRAVYRSQAAPITDRERAVLDLMADGLIAAAIARRLDISPRTVSKHIESIYRKLGTHDRTTTVLRGQAMGFLPAVRR